MKSKMFYPALLLGMVLGLAAACSSSDNASNESEAATAEEGGASFLAEGASDDEVMIKEGKGVGPVKNITLGAIDPALAETGGELFEAKCTACHKYTEEKYVGPGLKGVTTRRKPEWIMNMIINPEAMTKQDPTAQELLGLHMTQMTNQNIDEDGARKILEYMRQMDTQNP